MGCQSMRTKTARKRAAVAAAAVDDIDESVEKGAVEPSPSPALTHHKRPASLMNYPDGLNPTKKKRLISTNTTKYKGVYNSGKRFQAWIRIDGKQEYFGRYTTPIGTYDTAKEAALAVDRAIVQHKLSSSKLNFPNGYTSNSEDEEGREEENDDSSSSSSSSYSSHGSDDGKSDDKNAVVEPFPSQMPPLPQQGDQQRRQYSMPPPPPQPVAQQHYHHRHPAAADQQHQQMIPLRRKFWHPNHRCRRCCALREVLWQKAIHFIIETANMVGHDKLDDTKISVKLSIGLRKSPPQL
jgi:hypothetical protein